MFMFTQLCYRHAVATPTYLLAMHLKLLMHIAIRLVIFSRKLAYIAIDIGYYSYEAIHSSSVYANQLYIYAAHLYIAGYIYYKILAKLLRAI